MQRTPLLGVILPACFLYGLLQTTVVPALPSMQKEFGASPAAVSWVLTGFLLSAAVATPIFGKLGDVIGKGRVLRWVLVLLVVGSLISALAPTIEWLIFGRVIQGAAAGIFPLAIGIIRDALPPDEVAGGISLAGIAFSLGGGVGLPLAGVLLAHASASSLFWLGLLAAPSAFAVPRVVLPSALSPGVRVDALGAVLMSAALVLVLLPLSQAGAWGWNSARVVGLLLAGGTVAALWIFIESRCEQPLIQLRILRGRAVAITNAISFVVGFATTCGLLLLVGLTQSSGRGYGLGMTVTSSGLILLPFGAVQVLAGAVGPPLGVSVGFRGVLALGMMLLTASLFLLALVHDYAWQVLISAMLLGASLTFVFAAVSNLIVEAVPRADVGIATGINTIMRLAGGAFGSALATAILAAYTINGTDVPREAGYTVALLLAAVASAVGLSVTALLPRGLTRATASAEPCAAAATSAQRAEA